MRSPTTQPMTLKLSKVPSPEPLTPVRKHKVKRKGKHVSGLGDITLLRNIEDEMTGEGGNPMYSTSSEIEVLSTFNQSLPDWIPSMGGSVLLSNGQRVTSQHYQKIRTAELDRLLRDGLESRSFPDLYYMDEASAVGAEGSWALRTIPGVRASTQGQRTAKSGRISKQPASHIDRLHIAHTISQDATGDHKSQVLARLGSQKSPAKSRLFSRKWIAESGTNERKLAIKHSIDRQNQASSLFARESMASPEDAFESMLDNSQLAQRSWIQSQRPITGILPERTLNMSLQWTSAPDYGVRSSNGASSSSMVTPYFSLKDALTIHRNARLTQEAQRGSGTVIA